MLDDLRYAVRHFRKSPGFATAVILTLGLGIGAASAMFGLIQGVLLEPPPMADPDRLVLLSPARLDGEPYARGSSIGQWLDWREESRTIDAPALYRWTFNFLVLPDGSESLGGMVVTRNFFSVLGITPALGRELTAEEAGRTKVPPSGIILGHELWRRRFNADPGVIGTAVQLSRLPAPLPIVGVMPPGIRFLPDPANASEPNYDVHAHVDFWVAVEPDESQRTARGLNAVARLREGVTLEQARQELAGLAVRQAQADPNLEGLTTTARPVLDEMNAQARSLLLPLFGSVALVFLVACVNVAGLFVARGLQRHREYAMRGALGASRARLFRQLLTESAALSIVSAVVGSIVAAAIVTLFKAIASGAVPRADAVTVGWPVFAFASAAAILAALVAGALPAQRASSPHHVQALKGARTTAGRAERRLLGAIATVQIACTVALLAAAGLLVRTAGNLARVRPGYSTENILAVTVTTVTPNTWLDFHQRVLERVAALPGVTHAAFAWGLPLTGNKWMGGVELVGRVAASGGADELSLPLRSVTPDYFDLMGMAVVDGRGFRVSDDAKAARVAVVNQTLAARYFPDGRAVGRQMRMGNDPKSSIEIVGVVADTRTEAIEERPEPEIYLPFWQSGAFSKHLVMRAATDPAALPALVRREIHGVDPTAAVERFTTMAEIRRGSFAPRTFAMRLLIGFAIAAAGLSLVGVYGVLSLSVGSRVKEMAVRKAVGAQQRDIFRLILGEGGRLILVGIVLGSAVAVLAGRALEAQLFGVTPTDPVSLGAGAALFGILALGACLLPAVRAARTDLLAALHQD